MRILPIDFFRSSGFITNSSFHENVILLTTHELEKRTEVHNSQTGQLYMF